MHKIVEIICDGVIHQASLAIIGCYCGNNCSVPSYPGRIYDKSWSCEKQKYVLSKETLKK